MTKIDIPPDDLRTFFLIVWKLTQLFSEIWSFVFLFSHVSVKQAMSIALWSSIASISVVLSVFSELPKLWIFDSKNTGNFFCSVLSLCSIMGWILVSGVFILLLLVSGG